MFVNICDYRRYKYYPDHLKNFELTNKERNLFYGVVKADVIIVLNLHPFTTQWSKWLRTKLEDFNLEIQEIPRHAGSNEKDWSFGKTWILNGNIFCCNIYLTQVYLFKVNNGNTGRMCDLFTKLRVKTPEQYQWCHSGVFVVNSHIVLVFPLLTLNK